MAKQRYRQRQIDLVTKDYKQIEQMSAMGLRSTHIATILGFSKQSFFKILQRDPKAKMAFDIGKAEGTQKAITHLMSHIEAGSEKSLHFYLKFISDYNHDDEFKVFEELQEQARGTNLPETFTFELVDGTNL